MQISHTKLHGSSERRVHLAASKIAVTNLSDTPIAIFIPISTILPGQAEMAEAGRLCARLEENINDATIAG